MANVLIEESTMTGIADAIRAKTGGTDLMLPAAMPDEIAGIQTGSGIDTSDATATASRIEKDFTAYAKGQKITGTLVEQIPGQQNIHTTVEYEKITIGSSTAKYVNVTTRASRDAIVRKDSEYNIMAFTSLFGDATASDVADGKTFTSVDGVRLTGTHVCSTTEPTLQSKSVTPSESAQTVTPDDGYDGLSSVEVGAVSSTYIGSGVTQKSAAAYTPGTADQTIAAGQYLSGAQTIRGDANLLAANIKSGVSIFGVTGSYAGSGGGSGDNNCEAYHITSASATLNFKTTGTVKVWGYGHKSGGYMGTTYSFVGDGYYSGGYGTPSKTSVTFSISNGKLNGLPSGLQSVDLLVTIGV